MYNIILDSINLSYDNRCICQWKDMEIQRINRDIIFNHFLDNIIKFIYLILTSIISFKPLNIQLKIVSIFSITAIFIIFLFVRWRIEDKKYYYLNYIKSQLFDIAFGKGK